MPHVCLGPDLELCYETFGYDDDPTLLLVGGLGNQLLMWAEELCWSFVDRGFHVVRFDNRDAGLSTRLPEGAEYDLSDMARDVVGLLDGLGIERSHVLGMSLGGMIAQTVAIDHPARVATLTSVSANTGNPAYGRATDEVVAALTRTEPDDPDAAIESAVAARRVWSSPEWFDEEATRRYYRLQYERAPAANSARQLAAMLRTGDREPALADLDVPTLVVHGRADPLVSPDGGERTAEVIPGAELVLIDGMAHDLPVQMWPQLVERVTGLAARSASG